MTRSFECYCWIFCAFYHCIKLNTGTNPKKVSKIEFSNFSILGSHFETELWTYESKTQLELRTILSKWVHSSTNKNTKTCYASCFLRTFLDFNIKLIWNTKNFSFSALSLKKVPELLLFTLLLLTISNVSTSFYHIKTKNF